MVKPVPFDDFLKVTKQVSDHWLSLNVEPPLGYTVTIQTVSVNANQAAAAIDSHPFLC